MTKKIIYLVVLIAFFSINFSFPIKTTALSPTSTKSEDKDKTASSSDDIIDKLRQVEQLKQKIATKVAEIREKDKGALSGIITNIDKNDVTISTRNGDKNVIFSDDTLFFNITNGQKTESATGKLEKQLLISVLGYFDEKRGNLTAKFIYIQAPLTHVQGKIVNIDKDNFTYTVKEKKGDILVDIEKSTKTYSYDSKNDNFVKSGFSKIKIGDIVHISGKQNEKEEEDRITASNLYYFQNLNQSAITPPSSLSPTLQEKSTEKPSPTPKKS